MSKSKELLTSKASDITTFDNNTPKEPKRTARHKYAPELFARNRWVSLNATPPANGSSAQILLRFAVVSAIPVVVDGTQHVMCERKEQCIAVTPQQLIELARLVRASKSSHTLELSSRDNTSVTAANATMSPSHQRIESWSRLHAQSSLKRINKADEIDQSFHTAPS